MSTIQMKIEKVTPSKAATFLKGNDSNRTIRKNVVKRYARDMANGNWLESGDPIRFNGDGTLLDGQHRLSAIIESGVAQKILVIKGLDKASMLAMDTGAKRSFADMLRLQGFKNSMVLSALIRWCVLYEDPEREVCRDTCSHSEMMNWFAANPIAVEATTKAIASSNPILAKVRTPMAALNFYCKNQHDWDLFSARLAAGTGLQEGDPIHALRRWIENTSISNRKPHARVVQAVTIKAWNAYMEGENLKNLRFAAGGSVPEEFPTIVTGE